MPSVASLVQPGAAGASGLSGPARPLRMAPAAQIPESGLQRLLRVERQAGKVRSAERSP